MKKCLTLCLCLAALLCAIFITTPEANAATYGDLTYTVSNGEATITDCSTSATGELVIPSTIDGYVYSRSAAVESESFDPNTVYEQAKAMDFSGADADGKVTAKCPVCREEVEWNILPANPNTSSLTTVESGHYYLSESVDYTQNKGLYNFTKKQVCINLNGQTMVSSARAFYTESISSVLNMMGEGSVSGVGYMGMGVFYNEMGNGTVDLTTNANFYGGTYISTGVGPAIGNRKLSSSGDVLVSIYAGTTVINENPEGCAMHFMGYSSLAINGGTVNGAVIDNNSKGITVSGANVIDSLDLSNGAKITVGELITGANITVVADGVFTEEFDNAKAYLDAGYFVSGVTDTEVRVVGNALAIVSTATPEEPEPEPVVGIVTQPKDRSAVPGGKALFTVKAYGEGLKYQWQHCPSGGQWTELEGKTRQSLSVKDTVDNRNGQYRCRLTDATGLVVYTDAVTFRVQYIYKQPDSVTADVKTKATFQIETGLTEGFTYQWQYSRSGILWFDTTATGYNTDTLTVSAEMSRNGYHYRCVIKDAKGGKLISQEVRLYVDGAARITKQPQSCKTLGETAEFTVKAENVRSYQWQYSRTGSDKWFNTKMEGAKTDTLQAEASVYRDGYRYRCVLTGYDGEKVYTEAAELDWGI